MGGYDVQTGRSLCPVQVPADKVTALDLVSLWLVRMKSTISVDIYVISD
jgi:hypothetical protein